MAGIELRSLRGMHDVLPPDSQRWDRLEACFRQQVVAAGYGRIRTPIVEELAVFERVGAGTDVVSKEMYTFEDRDGTAIALKPESTAGVARSFMQHHPSLPWKVWYLSEHFRYERPQAGRFRQHHQLGAECFGAADPDVDVEMVVVLWDFFASIGLTGLRLELNSIGDVESRTLYVARLQAYLGSRVDEVSEGDRAKIELHPLRVLDSKHPDTRAVLVDAPVITESMTPTARDHFERVQDGVRAAGIPFQVNTSLVRGLDYYTHTVFEIISTSLDAAQSTIGGGGRYDGLVESLGGPPTSGVGFGAGIERILLACDAEGVFAEPVDVPDVFVVNFGGDAGDVRDCCLELRRAGIRSDRAFDGRSGRAQMKLAGRSGASWCVIFGDDERERGTVTIRDLRDAGTQTEHPRTELVPELRKRLL